MTPSVSLPDVAREVRRHIIDMVDRARKGHIGGSLSCVEILVALYHGGILKHRALEPRWAGRDRLVFSKGHAIEALYSVLAEAGFFPRALLETYGMDGSPLGGHPDRNLPGIEVSTGSLGHGLGIAAGMALAARHQEKSHRIFVVLGDGECYEGSIWEAAQFAAHHRLGRLVAIVDRNRQITLDDTEDCNAFEPFAAKWRAFGWDVAEVNGHDFDALRSALGEAPGQTERPLVVLASTKKGRGVGYMEREVGWHHRVPKGAEVEEARRDIETLVLS